MARLEQEILHYTQGGHYPFHMPGHKRMAISGVTLPYQTDVTEIPATDDLHEAEGILRQAMDRTASLYGADRSWYLVNGSTCGNLAGIFALTHQGGEILCARNCHRSVFHAIGLRGLKVHWILPEYDAAFGFFGSVAPEKVAELLDRYPKVEALVLTSPTYEGVTSDIGTIASLCHARGVALFVDEAHGAHFSVDATRDIFPQSAISLGADLVVQSAHKTLPSLTQTAWLHMKSELVKEKTIEKMLGIFETSSPSYPLMISMDACTELLEEQGSVLFSDWYQKLACFYEGTANLKNLRICYADPEPPSSSEMAAQSAKEEEDAWDRLRVQKASVLRQHPAFFDLDLSKLVIHTGSTGKSGRALADALRSRFQLEPEMSQANYVLAMTGALDTDEGYQRLRAALYALDAEWAVGNDGSPQTEVSADTSRMLSALSEEVVCPIGEAVNGAAVSVSWQEAVGRVAAEYVYLYPPGIPLIMPGERVTQKCITLFCALDAREAVLHFTDSEEAETLLVLDKEYH